MSRSAEEKDYFRNQILSLTGSIPVSSLIVVAGDLSGHVATSVDGYDGELQCSVFT